MCSKSACEQVARDVIPAISSVLEQKYSGARTYIDRQHPSVIYLEIPEVGVFELNVWDLTPERCRKGGGNKPIGPDTWYFTNVDGELAVYKIEKPEDMNDQHLQQMSKRL